MQYYTGVGSRSTPPEVCRVMVRLAKKLNSRGYRLRSGHAEAADRAFEIGAEGNADIYLPWKSFGQGPYKGDPGMPVCGTPVVVTEARANQYYQLLCDLGIRHDPSKRSYSLLHGRNVCQVLGDDPIHHPVPSKFLACWCPVVNGKPQGGTATAVQLAEHYNVPVRNLFLAKDLAGVLKFLEGDES